MKADTFDCQSCGACCVHAGDILVGKDEPTPRYLQHSIRGRVGFLSDEHETHRCMAKDAQGRCFAFRGEIGYAVRCATYLRRPKVCRELQSGTPACLESRKAAGITDSLKTRISCILLTAESKRRSGM